MIRATVSLPLIAAGGIGSGKQMLACFALGAEAVQIGSSFVASTESSAHINFKNAVIQTNEGDTQLTLKELTPVRLIKNKFYKTIQEAEARGADVTELTQLLGRGRAKKGMFEGDLDEGELEIGQISAAIREIMPASAIVSEIWNDFLLEKEKLNTLTFKS
jgi:enoyl-[acyl-carrier protein] reductase II